MERPRRKFYKQRLPTARRRVGQQLARPSALHLLAAVGTGTFIAVRTVMLVRLRPLRRGEHLYR